MTTRGARESWYLAWSMARRMVGRRREWVASAAALWFARHAARRGLSRTAVIYAARVAAAAVPWAAVGRRDELERMFGGRVVAWAQVSRSCPDLWLAAHHDPLARVYLRRATRAWIVRRWTDADAEDRDAERRAAAAAGASVAGA